MYNYLTAGDSKYQLQDAQSLRSSIAKQAEYLDVISKKILAIPEDPEQPKAVLLQATIRRATSQYIKDYLLTLPVLPNPTELEKIRKERVSRYTETPKHVASSNIKKMAVTTGWSPQNLPQPIEQESCDDPLIEQINLVRNYIRQARKDKRFEEVASLEENLRELKRIYHDQLREGNSH